MMDLGWEGTFGYGDVAGAIANACWHAHMKGSPVNLHMFWHTDRKFYPPSNKYHPDDPESVLERVEIIKQMFIGHENVNLIHRDYTWEGEDEQYRPKFKHRWKEGQWYGTVWDTNVETSDQGYICVWHPLNNVEQVVKDPHTCYKDPLSMNNTWQELFDKLKGYDVRYVSYRDPIQQTLDTIAGAKLCIGYEGMGQVLAKNMWKPMVTFSMLSQVSYITSGPWVQIDDKPGRWLKDIDGLVARQHRGIKECQRRFEELKNEFRHRQSSN